MLSTDIFERVSHRVGLLVREIYLNIYRCARHFIHFIAVIVFLHNSQVILFISRVARCNLIYLQQLPNLALTGCRLIFRRMTLFGFVKGH